VVVTGALPLTAVTIPVGAIVAVPDGIPTTDVPNLIPLELLVFCGNVVAAVALVVDGAIVLACIVPTTDDPDLIPLELELPPLGAWLVVTTPKALLQRLFPDI